MNTKLILFFYKTRVLMFTLTITQDEVAYIIAIVGQSKGYTTPWLNIWTAF